MIQKILHDGYIVQGENKTNGNIRYFDLYSFTYRGKIAKYYHTIADTTLSEYYDLTVNLKNKLRRLYPTKKYGYSFTIKHVKIYVGVEVE